MGDLEVDLAQLKSTAEALGVLGASFDGASGTVDSFREAMGDDVHGALHSFATNWSTHRRSINESIKAVKEMCETSHKTYVDVDDKLANSVRISSDVPAEG